MRRLPWLLFVAAVLVACAASVLAIWADDAWLADLAVNFRLQYLAVALLAAPVLAWRRELPLIVAAVVTLALNAGPVLQYLGAARATAVTVATPSSAPAPTPLPAPVPAPDSAPVPLRLASANVFFLNHEHAAVIAWARRTRPDVLLLLEATAEWRRGLAPLEAEYPYVQYATDQSHHGLLLLSRWPLAAVVTRPTAEQRLRPVVFATVTKAGAQLRLAAMHATWPMQPDIARQRQRDLDLLATEAGRRGSLPFVGVGDLNISPFSPHYQRLLHDTGLRNAAAGRGWQPTWPAMFLPVGIQIDHALVSPEIEVTAFHRGPANGSDHMSIIVDVLIPRISLRVARP